ncbi:unnamed protein product [Darwinula stevensoni]|uniref:ZAD domain-containing protein n=1 Tax=Darwinula stevensoni TaxID=69355 RepID=A0A7R8X3L4_9CRUS|nr:unnamed protein product [Darwinula stevensoni]CAG0882469.1 unnamed protein product [Darwinula stevensoni]
MCCIYISDMDKKQSKPSGKPKEEICVICGLSDDQCIHISASYTLTSDQPVVWKLTCIIPLPAGVLDSRTLCTRCFALLNEIDRLESLLTEKMYEMRNLYEEKQAMLKCCSDDLGEEAWEEPVQNAEKPDISQNFEPFDEEHCDMSLFNTNVLHPDGAWMWAKPKVTVKPLTARGLQTVERKALRSHFLPAPTSRFLIPRCASKFLFHYALGPLYMDGALGGN